MRTRETRRVKPRTHRPNIFANSTIGDRSSAIYRAFRRARLTCYLPAVGNGDERAFHDLSANATRQPGSPNLRKRFASVHRVCKKMDVVA